MMGLKEGDSGSAADAAAAVVDLELAAVVFPVAAAASALGVAVEGSG